MNDENKTPNPNQPPEATPLEEELGHEAVEHALMPTPIPGEADEANEQAAAKDILEQDAEEKAELDEHYEDAAREMEKKPEDRPQ
jgi:hypothetical protein